jgi:chromosome segregation ATPase
MKTKNTPNKKAPDRASDLPVTVGIIEEFREEMRASFRSVDHRFDSLRSELKGDISSLRSELKGDISGVKADIEDVKADIAGVKADIEDVKADTSRTKMLMEEQTHRNNIVLDGLTSLFERQERSENRIDEVERTMALFKKAKT